jgi:phospholipase/carboxylesterase
MLEHVSYIDSPESPTLMLLHGYGSNKDDLFSLQPYFPGMNILCFQAPKSLDQGGFAWYDIDWTNGTKIIDPAAVKDISRSVMSDIDTWKNKNHITGKTIVGGFSQGGILSMSIYSLNYEADAFVVMSGYMLPEWAEFNWLKDTPLLQTHGMADPVIPFEWAEAGALKLGMNPNYSFNSYQMGHHLNAQCITDVQLFLETI